MLQATKKQVEEVSSVLKEVTNAPLKNAATPSLPSMPPSWANSDAFAIVPFDAPPAPASAHTPRPSFAGLESDVESEGPPRVSFAGLTSDEEEVRLEGQQPAYLDEEWDMAFQEDQLVARGVPFVTGSLVTRLFLCSVIRYSVMCFVFREYQFTCRAEDETALAEVPALPHQHNAVSKQHKEVTKAQQLAKKADAKAKKEAAQARAEAKKDAAAAEAKKGTPVKETPPAHKKRGTTTHSEELKKWYEEKKRVHSKAWHGARTLALGQGRSDADAKAPHPLIVAAHVAMAMLHMSRQMILRLLFVFVFSQP